MTPETEAHRADGALEILDRFSGLLLQLYGLAETLAADRFQAQAFNRLGALIPFDAGWWALGVDDFDAGGNYQPQTFDTYLHNLSRESLGEYNKLNQFDTIAQAVAAQPGVTLNAIIRDWYPEAYWPYLDAQGYRHALSTTITDPITGLTAGITLYRAATGHPFSEQERRLKQALTPHLMAALNRIQFDPWIRQALPAPEYLVAAIADTHGLLRHAAEGFGEMLQREWPDWRGPILPEALRALLCGIADEKFSGKHIVAKISLRQHMPLIQVRACKMADHLSEQQLMVARHSVDGLRYKEIARLVDLSPATVRNYLTIIYRKLEVSNKLQLAEKVRAVE